MRLHPAGPNPPGPLGSSSHSASGSSPLPWAHSDSLNIHDLQGLYWFLPRPVSTLNCPFLFRGFGDHSEQHVPSRSRPNNYPEAGPSPPGPLDSNAFRIRLMVFTSRPLFAPSLRVHIPPLSSQPVWRGKGAGLEQAWRRAGRHTQGSAWLQSRS